MEQPFSDAFWESMREADRRHAEMREEYDRLRAQAPASVKPGDRVLVAAHIVGRGYAGARLEAEARRVSGTSVLLDFLRKRALSDEQDEQWVDVALVLSVLGKDSP